MTEVTRAEVCAIACAEAFRGNGEILASPMALVPSLGARLARETFEPDLLLSDGEATFVAGPWALGAKPPTTIVVGQSSHSSSARGRLGSGPSAVRPREGSSPFPEVFGSNDRR